jgi:RNA methyltransferase, TrmH family
MTTITSLQNLRVKDAVRLRDRRHREKQGRILIDGARELLRALNSGLAIQEVFVCEPLCAGDDARAILAMLPSCGCETLHVTEAVFVKLAFGQRAEGVLGVGELPMAKLQDIERRIHWPDKPNLKAVVNKQLPSPFGRGAGGEGGLSAQTPTSFLNASNDSSGAAASRQPENPLVVILEGVEKPGNIGAVLRSADGAGFHALIAADPRTDLFNPNAIRASLGTIFTMPVCVAESMETLDWLRGHDMAIVAARVDAKLPYNKADFRRPTAIVLGSEAEGLSPVWSGNEVTAVRLPMLGAADSLNVSAAAAVLFYEARRQRGWPERI